MLNAFNSSYYDQKLEPNKMWENWLNIFTTITDTHACSIKNSKGQKSTYSVVD